MLKAMAKYEEYTEEDRRRVAEARGEVRKTSGGLGKSFAQLQAEEMASRRFTDLMASAGIGKHQMAQEMLFFLPRQFVDAYEQVWVRAFGGKDDGGVNARGQAAAESGALQKGKSAARKGVGKRYKKHWMIADEHALDLKEKVDKRLRALGREILEDLADRSGSGPRDRSGERVRCGECGRTLQASWDFCPFDGRATTRG